jgi:PAS domain S-box-containing protein
MTDAATPPRLPDEAERLATLRAVGVLDTPADPALDVITRLAADRFDAEIALVSLVDADRQWFKSRHGLDVCETSRADSFCAHTIAGSGVMVVADASADPRFAANPLVLGSPFIRFYAAAPLVTSTGYRIGTLCVIDRRPRDGFPARDCVALQLMAGQVMDWIETKQMRQEQRISQLIAETTTDAFVCSDANSRIIHWNRAAEAMFGWSAAEAVGRSLDLIIPNRHRHGHNMGMERLRTRGPTKLVGKTVEVPATCKAGHEIPIELSLGMWPAEGEGEPEGFAAIIRDVTARKRLEAQRAATEAMLAQQLAAIEASDDGIAVTDADGRFIFMNRSHATLFGYPDATHLIGKPWSVLYDEAVACELTEQAMPVVFSVGRWRGEVKGRRADGSVIEQEVSLSRASEGGIVCVTRDIGDRLGMEREKARLREQLMLAQRQETVGQLASGIAHDFNNLIAAIAGTAGLLEAVPDDGVRRHALRIQQAAGTATALVDKLLALGGRTPDFKRIDLRRVLTNVRDLVRPSLADTRQRIDLELPDAPLFAMADETELLQVVLNLALNARDALVPNGDGRITLSLLAADGHTAVGEVLVGSIPSGPAALIRVSDTGCGIAPNELSRVFQPFFTRKGEGGTGLGLAVVAGIVGNAGGAIALFSRRGAGTIFELFWPLHSATGVLPLRAPMLAADADVLTGKAVLVVDDNPAVVDTLVAMLDEAGAEPGPCLDPADALGAVEEDPAAWDLVITDYDMPGMNGAALARRLRAIRADLPLLLMTALPRLLERRNGEAALFDAVLAKPATMAALVDAARIALSMAQDRTR